MARVFSFFCFYPIMMKILEYDSLIEFFSYYYYYYFLIEYIRIYIFGSNTSMFISLSFITRLFIFSRFVSIFN